MHDGPENPQAAPQGFGLVLGGGGARGFAYIGVARVLERAGLRPSAIAGTSMGGLIGALIAAGNTTERITASLQQTPPWLYLNLNPFADALDFDRLHRTVGSLLPDTFEALPTPLALTATDLVTGEAVCFSSGDLMHAIRCTIAYPGLVNPVPDGARLLADGGIADNLPVSAARALGATRVVAVNVVPLEPLTPHQPDWWGRLLRREPRLDEFRTLLRAADVMQHRITQMQLATDPPDLIITPQVPGMTIFDFDRVDEAVQAGADAATAARPRLTRVLYR